MKRWIHFLIVLMSLGVGFTVACNKSDVPTRPQRDMTQRNAETMTGLMTSSVLQLSGAVMQNAEQNLGGSNSDSIAPRDNPPTYDDATGWWTLQIQLSNGTHGTIQVQFRDEGNKIQKFYNPVTTKQIRTKGDLSHPMGPMSFDITLAGVNRTANLLIVNGTGTMEYQSMEGTMTVQNLTIPKTSGSYPSSGTLYFSMEGMEITVTFNGTNTAHGSYSYMGETFTFDINLDTGVITPTG